MLAKSFLLFLSVFLFGHVLCQGMTPACQERDTELLACSSHLGSSIANDPSIGHLCSEIETFINCQHTVNITCPENPLLLENIYVQGVRQLESLFNQHCPRNVSQILCEYNTLFYEFAPLCYPIVTVNQEPSTPLHVMCSNTRKYLRCIETVNAPCVDMEHNLRMGISLTKTGLRAQCSDEDVANSMATRDTSAAEETQGDSPAEVTVVSENDCSVHGVGARVALCSRHLLPTYGIQQLNSSRVCIYSRRYLRCIRRLLNKCSSAQNLQATIYDPYHAVMVNLCEINSGRCPFDVMEGELNLIEYCAGRVSYEIGSTEFCRHVSKLPKCLVRTKNRCRHRGFRRSDIRSALIAVNATYNNYCENDVTERSLITDLDVLDLEERSNPIGQLNDDALSDVDVVDDLEYAVKLMNSVQ